MEAESEGTLEKVGEKGVISAMALGQDAGAGDTFHSTDFSDLPFGRGAQWCCYSWRSSGRGEVSLKQWLIVGSIVHAQVLRQELNANSLNGREHFWLTGQTLAHPGHWSLLKRVRLAAGRHRLHPTRAYRLSALTRYPGTFSGLPQPNSSLCHPCVLY